MGHTPSDYFSQLETHLFLLIAARRVEPIRAPVAAWEAETGLGGRTSRIYQPISTSYTCYVVPGSHYSIMMPPQVDTIAAGIAARLCSCAKA